MPGENAYYVLSKARELWMDLCRRQSGSALWLVQICHRDLNPDRNQKGLWVSSHSPRGPKSYRKNSIVTTELYCRNSTPFLFPSKGFLLLVQCVHMARYGCTYTLQHFLFPWMNPLYDKIPSWHLFSVSRLANNLMQLVNEIGRGLKVRRNVLENLTGKKVVRRWYQRDYKIPYYETHVRLRGWSFPGEALKSSGRDSDTTKLPPGPLRLVTPGLRRTYKQDFSVQKKERPASPEHTPCDRTSVGWFLC